MRGIPKNPRLTGAVLLIGSAQFVISMIVEQLLLVPPHYAYDPFTQAISDLGNTATNTPYSLIFDTSVFLIGVLSMLGAVLLAQFAPRVRGAKVGLFFLFLAGLGAMGVGLSPENVDGTVHGISALFAFLFGGLALILLGPSAQVLLERGGIRIAMAFGGLFDLVSIGLFLGSAGGPGYYGFDERLIVVPVLAWAILFGGLLLLGKAHLPEPGRKGAVPAPASAP